MSCKRCGGEFPNRLSSEGWDTGWWHDYCWERSAVEHIATLEGKLSSVRLYANCSADREDLFKILD